MSSAAGVTGALRVKQEAKIGRTNLFRLVKGFEITVPVLANGAFLFMFMDMLGNLSSGSLHKRYNSKGSVGCIVQFSYEK